MKKIAILLGNITYGAGTERAVTNLANMLVTYGNYDVTIISIFSLSTMKPYFNLNENVKVVHLGLKNDSILNRIISYKTLISKMNQLIKREAYDFLLGTTHAFNCLMICMSKSIKKIACEHMPYNAARFYARMVRRFVYPRLNAVVLLTEKDRERYPFCGNTWVIPNSIEGQSKSSTCENKIILAIGRLTEQKGFDLLIKSFSLIHEDLPEWQLRIVGQGKDKEKLAGLIEENNLANKIKLISPTKDIKTEYLNAGMFVLSSRFEGFGLVLAEAKSFGLPSVSFDCAYGPSDILHDGIDGYLVPPENIEELGQQIIKLANDVDLRKRFGFAAKEDIKRFSAQELFSIWEKVFSQFQ